MSLFALGINHHAASVTEREKIALTVGATSDIIGDLFSHPAVDEAVVLSTCNRTEIYSVTKCHNAVKEWLRRHYQQETPLLNKLYEHHDLQVIKHLMAVASGLNSMIVGEPQILGQLKRAYHVACEKGTIGKQFRQLFPAVFETAKLVRTETDIGSHAVTLAYAVIQLAKKQLFNLEDSVVMLIGSGETVELIADYLYQHNVKRVMIANRTLTRAHQLARRYRGIPLPLSEMPQILPQADIIISAVTRNQPVLSAAQIQQAQQQRDHKPVFIADLGVPRNIDSAVAGIHSVRLHNMDSLQHVITENQQSRYLAVDKARDIIEMRAAHYLRLLRVREASDTIRHYRQKMESWRDQSLNAGYNRLKKGEDPKTVIKMLANQLTQKFMHPPTVKLREACYAEEAALLDTIKEIYEL